MRQVYLARDPTDAHAVRGLLEVRGIRAVVRGEDLWSADVPYEDGLPTVWIEDDMQAAPARAFLATYEASPQPQVLEEAWVCSGCGEKLDVQFTACWACGTERRI